MFEKKLCKRVEFSFPVKSGHVLDQGIGVNWAYSNPELERYIPCTPPISDTERWKMIFERLDFVKPACFRFAMFPSLYLDENAAFNWDAPIFIELKWVDEWACKNNATIVVDPFIIPRQYIFGVDKDGVDCAAPMDIHKYVNNFVIPLLEHIHKDMKLKSVTHFIVMNEPLLGNGRFYTPEGIDRFEYYVECHRVIFEELKKRNIAIKLIGPDSWATIFWAVEQFNERGLNLSPYIDAYDSHNYFARFDYLPPNHNADTTPEGCEITQTCEPMTETIENHVYKNARFARMKGKKYYITELGSFYYGWISGDPYGTTTHEAFITEAEFIVRSMAQGCSGFYKWCFLSDSEEDGIWPFIMTTDGTYDIQVNPYYGYAAMMRYTMKNSAVWAPQFKEKEEPYQFVHSVALELPDGNRTIFVVNDHNCQERVIEAQLPELWDEGGWQKILDDRTRKAWRSEFEMKDGKLTDVVPPMSLCVYTTKRWEDDVKLRLNPNILNKL